MLLKVPPFVTVPRIAQSLLVLCLLEAFMTQDFAVAKGIIAASDFFMYLPPIVWICTASFS